MYGYIYITENKLNGRKYIGKHEASEYDESYYGSGKILKEAIKKYGVHNFTNKILYVAETREELNIAEKTYIDVYKRKYGRNLYNIASGGDGGNVYFNASEEEKKSFSEKMTAINRKRCGSQEFKKRMSEATSKRYESDEERKRQSEKIRKSWSDELLRREQSERLRAYYKENPPDKSYLKKPCLLYIDNKELYFDSIKSLRQYLSEAYGFEPSRSTLHQLIETELPYRPFHKNKWGRLDGIIIKQVKSVETMGDEYNPVGCEIGTHPKRKTEIEEIVRSV